MALHPTAALSFGDPPPTYHYLPGNQLAPESCAVLLRAGESVHVGTQEQAAAILKAVGLTDEEVAFRMRVADGSWAHGALEV